MKYRNRDREPLYLMDEQGRIVLPTIVRDVLGLTPQTGFEIKANLNEEELILKKISRCRKEHEKERL